MLVKCFQCASVVYNLRELVPYNLGALGTFVLKNFTYGIYEIYSLLLKYKFYISLLQLFQQFISNILRTKYPDAPKIYTTLLPNVYGTSKL